jgi:eukaryotic-like serine/threonine-protein kinase
VRNEGALTSPTVPTPPDDAERPTVAGYDLVRVLGRGGMGVVWDAIEHRFDRRVAVKVHLKGRETQDADLWVEAFVAARIGDPGIVRVLDVGYTIDQRPFYAMELVDGTDLGTLVADGPMQPRRAIAIAADVARAVAAAHQHGVIHRDLKPRNVIIDTTGRARVVDFGIAIDFKTGHDPFAGQVAGSPPYMSPEQARGKSVTPAADVWAIGVMLYEMLTGLRPFAGAKTDELLRAIVYNTPDPPSAKDPQLHADLDAVVLRCLSKKPEERYSAGALFATLDGIASGKRVDVPPSSNAARSYKPKVSTLPPAERPKRADAKKHLAWSWKLASSAAELWPHVADTERFNRAVGLSPVLFTDEAKPDGTVERSGELRVLGLHVRWREYPFEWIARREHSVFRWYRAGPLSALWNKVTLDPLPDGGTELRHEIWISPRGLVGQIATFFEIERKLGAAIDRFYRRLDEVLVAKSGLDPFQAPHHATPEQRELVESGCAKLHAARFSAPIVEKLAMHLLTTPDGGLTALRPYELADAWELDRAEVLDAMIHAAHYGLLEPAWDVVCPKCMIAHESLDALARVTRLGTCTACASSFERDLRESVELVFLPHPGVRHIERITYCAGAPAKRPHVVAQQVLDPGEERRIKVDLTRGAYRVAAAATTHSYDLVASAVGFEPACEVRIDDTGTRVVGTPAIVLAGEVTFALHNTSDHEETFRIEVPGARGDGVSAATALTHPSFRAFFSSELLAHGEHLPVRHLAFLFVELLKREALFEKLGDAAACAELTRLDDLVHEHARAHEGTVVPSSLDVLVVGFASPPQALRAALALRKALDEDPLSSNVALAIHDGRCIALTREGKPEFFGETLHRGQSLLRDCPERGIALSASFAAHRTIAVALHDSAMTVSVTKTEEGPYAGRRLTLLT